ncbi:MAG: hypothetical protein ACTH54_08645 [Vagococcus salmoninarum]|uniref:hypothetical protein n=1 Tax=Vagococcus salmoninarum TaxID=2739 RepID=UPI003F972688
MNCYFENGVCVMTPMSTEEWTSKVSKAFSVTGSQIKAGSSEEMPIFQMEKLSKTEGCLNE